MSSGKNANPPNAEVERQLEKMLASPVFTSRGQQAKVLECIVRGALAGEAIMEKYIRAKVFPSPPYKPESNIARRTVDLVRDLLTEYYAQDGKDDLVLISLPQSPPGKRIKFQAGHAYKPSFRYNPSSEAARHYRRGLYHFSRVSLLPDIKFALASFESAIKANSSYAPAHSALAEVQLFRALCNHDVPPSTIIELAEASVRKALHLNPTLWRARLSFGLIHMCRHDWNKATLAINEALSVAPAEVRKHPVHLAFLLAMGRTDEVMPFVGLRNKQTAADPWTLAVAGLFLYAARRFREADLLLMQTIVNNPMSCWLTHLLFSCINLAKRSDHREGAAINFRAARKLAYMSPHQPVLFPGLGVLCLAPSEKAQAKSEFLQLRKRQGESYVTHFHLALAYLGMGKEEQAVKFLEQACNESEPWTAWLHVLPLFDPLRQNAAFQALVSRISPANSK